MRILTLAAIACLLVGSSVAIALGEYNNTSGQYETFRCGNELVEIGDSPGKVFMRCGEPTWKEAIGFTDGYLENQIWYYNCGSNDFLYLLRFVGGRLKAIESQGYGTGQSDCYGPRRR